MYSYLVKTYLKFSGGLSKLSYGAHCHTHEINSEYALGQDELINRVSNLLSINSKDYEFVILDNSYSKLEQDFITLEKSYEQSLDKIEKLEKQISDKDKHIKRLNLEAQRWFDMSMDLLYGNKCDKENE